MELSLTKVKPKNGDLIAYGVRSGNSGDLHLGVIVDVENDRVIALSQGFYTGQKDKYGSLIYAWRKGRSFTFNGRTKYVILDSCKDETVNVLQRMIQKDIVNTS